MSAWKGKGRADVCTTVLLNGSEFEQTEDGRLIGPNGPITPRTPTWSDWKRLHPGYVPPQPKPIPGVAKK